MVLPNRRLFLIVAVISFCSNWQFAFQITYVNTSVKTFYDLANEGYRTGHDCRFCWLPAESWSSAWSTIVSSFYPGSILGFLLTPAFTSHIGIKRTQILMCLAAVLGCSVHFLAPQISVYKNEAAVSLVLIIGRFLVGIQGGSSLCLLPLYVIEVSPVEHRPFLSTFQQVSQAVGTFLGLVIGSEDILPLGVNRFIWLQAFAIAPTILFLFVLLMTPKTPHQTYKNKCPKEEVMKSIQYYHGDDSGYDFVKRECTTIEKQHEAENRQGSTRTTSCFGLCNIPWATWKGFFIGSLAAISYGFTADDLVDTFSSQILNNTIKDDAKAADLISVGFGLILVISSLFGTILIDRFGRRKLLLFGLVGTAVSNSLAIFFSDNAILVTIGFALTKAFIGLGAGAPAWFLTSELVEAAHVSLFQSLSTGLLLTSNMLVTFFYLQLEMMIGSWSVLALASGPAFFLAVLLFVFLPETKDKTVDEVQIILRENTFSAFPSQKPNAQNQIYGSI
ncbi:unnamed protein product [Auanema sp. JU1783]|nr:unnamed protein product [Auanema sp. JU1783]